VEHVRVRRDAGGEGLGANSGHAGTSEAGGAGIATTGERHNQAVATAAVAAGMEELGERQREIVGGGERPRSRFDFAGIGSFCFARQTVVEEVALRGGSDGEMAGFVKQVAGPGQPRSIEEKRAARDAKAGKKSFFGDFAFPDREADFGEEGNDGIEGAQDGAK